MKKLKTRLEYREIYKWIILFLIVFLIYKFINKEGLIGVIRTSLPPVEAGLLNGMLLGDTSGFEKNFYNYLKDSGLVHLVVVSGSNVMLLVGGGIESVAGFFGRKKVIAGGLILGWAYTAMVGWEIPVIRAMLLLSIYYWAQLWGRKYNLSRGLGLAILLMVLGEPMVLLSVSFWLSITAFLGVVTVKNKWLTTVWVGIWITPILGLIFGKISLISPLTNIMVLGITELITVLGAVGAVVGLVVPEVGKLILWLGYPWLKYLSLVAESGGFVGFGVLMVKFNWWMLIGWYAILGYFLLKNKYKIATSLEAPSSRGGLTCNDEHK